MEIGNEEISDVGSCSSTITVAFSSNTTSSRSQIVDADCAGTNQEKSWSSLKFSKIFCLMESVELAIRTSQTPYFSLFAKTTGPFILHKKDLGN